MSVCRKGVWAQVAAWVVTAACVVVIPLVTNAYILGVALDVAMFAVLALGLNVVVGYAGLLDLGYAAFYAIGAYTTALLLIHTQWSFWFIWPIAGLAAGIFGLIIGLPTLRLRSDYLAIVTLGFGEITRLTITNLSFTGGATGLYGLRAPVLFGQPVVAMSTYYFLALAMVAVGAAFSIWIRRTRLGHAWVYVRHDESVAQALGVNSLAVKLWAYGLGAIWGGLVGALFVEAQTAVSPTTFTFDQSLLIVIAVILGGQGSYIGALLGALLVVGVPELLRPLESWRLLLFGVVLVVLMMGRPEGLLGRRLGALRAPRDATSGGGPR